MDFQILGNSGLRVSELALGTITFGNDWGWGAPPEECRKLFDAYAESGGNLIDTANTYTNGSSEEIVGQILEGQRDQFVLATKYTLTSRSDDPNASGSHRKNLVQSLEASLRRLRTDYIDLYWVHIWDPRTPTPELMRALDDQVRAGKVLHVGVSDSPAWVVARANTLAEWRDWSPFTAIQAQYNLVERGAERDLLPMARSFGMGALAWGPLAAGVLSGKYTSSSAASPPGVGRVDAASVPERQLEIARAVQRVAGDVGFTPSQVALAWIRQQPGAVIPIVGARKLDQLHDNLACLGLTLDPSQLEILDRASAIDLGFPHDFIVETQDLVYGTAGKLVR